MNIREGVGEVEGAFLVSPGSGNGLYMYIGDQ